jgi:meso-butanediol dehydrogenase/(S,S)-butanediol dehydrogenase/diacetyl reductase
VARFSRGFEVRFRLEGRRALITGAAGGIGSAVARTFIDAGATVALIDRDAPGLERIAQSLSTAHSIRPVAIRADVTRSADVKRAVGSATRRLGGLDIVVTAAGVTSKGDLATTDLKTWRRLIDINLTGTFLVCHEAIPHLRRSAAGAIVTISSVYSLIGGRERTAYSASKGGIDALTRSMAGDLARHGIRVNTVNPGFIRTAMTEPSQKDRAAMRFFRDVTLLPRFGEAQDVADAILYLAAPASGFVTGVCLALDGGRSLGR